MDKVAFWQAQAASEVLQHWVPQAPAQLSALLLRLFQAVAAGDGCIRLSDEEQASLQDAHSLVGNAPHATTPLIRFACYLALGRVWQLEAEIAQDLRRLSRPCLPDHNLSALLHILFADEHSREQQQAAALAAVNQLTLITGGPGTGKTTTVAKLLCLLCHGQTTMPRIALAAPTGKAAARMTESLRLSLQHWLAQPALSLPEASGHALLALEGKTLHRLLGMRPPQMRPYYHRHQCLPYDIIIVDETSMLDSSMLHHLLAAVGEGTRLILLGDAHQLPPVGMGELLSVLPSTTVLWPEQAALLSSWLPAMPWAQSETPPPLAAQTARLTISHRFAHDSGIGRLAQYVLHQQVDELADVWQQYADIELQDAGADAREMANQLWPAMQTYWQAVAAGDAAVVLRAWSERMLLTARRRDAEAVNLAWRALLTRHALMDELQGDCYHGQALMVVRNDVEMGLFNGDVGVVLRDDAGRLQAYFPSSDGVRAVPLSRLPEHEDAFAMTVHKSQGSEFSEVWLLPPLGTPEVAEDYNRALLYTAITRAKRRFVYWGSVQSLQDACLRHSQRLTVLDYILHHEH